MQIVPCTALKNNDNTNQIIVDVFCQKKKNTNRKHLSQVSFFHFVSVNFTVSFFMKRRFDLGCVYRAVRMGVLSIQARNEQKEKRILAREKKDP